jgi:hypothetical protein
MFTPYMYTFARLAGCVKGQLGDSSENADTPLRSGTKIAGHRVNGSHNGPVGLGYDGTRRPRREEPVFRAAQDCYGTSRGLLRRLSDAAAAPHSEAGGSA